MKFLKDEDGFTLIEIMLSLVLAVLLIFAFSNAIINGLRSETLINKRLEAIRISNSLVEQLRYIRNNEDGNWINIQGNFEDYTINFEESGENVNNNTDDIFIKHKTVGDDLHSFEIIWKDRNYNLELLLAGGS
jgi:Tfp pilus assembly protein FimT